ncbi:MAG: hypothetical protein PIR53_18685 [Nocardioides alkalitolerans]
MWFAIFCLLVVGGVLAYVFRVQLLAKVLGPSGLRAASGGLRRPPV